MTEKCNFLRRPLEILGKMDAREAGLDGVSLCVYAGVTGDHCVGGYNGRGTRIAAETELDRRASRFLDTVRNSSPYV